MSRPKGAGQGCWASSKTLAAGIGRDVTNVSTAINQLVKWGYLAADKRPEDKRMKVYRVVFDQPTPEDRLPSEQTTSLLPAQTTQQASLPAGQTIVHDPNGTLHDVHESDPLTADSLPQGDQSPKVVCVDQSANPQKTANPDKQYIPLSGERYSAEAGKRNSPEGARRLAHGAVQKGGGSNVSAQLAQWEREIRADPVGCTDLGYVAMLEKFEDRWAGNDKLCGRARRLKAQLADACEAARA